MTDTSGDEAASLLASEVSELLADSRETHGDAIDNHRHIAELWGSYLRARDVPENEPLQGYDVARMMILVKMSRAATGSYDLDHDRDMAGYAAIAGACATDGDI